MKRILIFMFIVTGLICRGQAVIGMSPIYSFTPANANTPASTVTYSTSITLKVYAKNTGNANYNGVIGVTAYRDTTGGVFCDSVSTFLSFLQPNDSLPIVLTFIPSSGVNAFKSGGNGNTIVVWPFVAPGTATGDSVRPILYINDPNGIYEFEKGMFKIYPNPVLEDLIIKSKDNIIYKNIIIYDVFARKVKEFSYKEKIDVSELNSGTYWMIIESEKKSYRIPFIKE